MTLPLEKVRIVFEVKRLYHAPEQARTAQDLKLGVEINRVVLRADKIRGLEGAGGVLQVYLHLRPGLIYIRLARHVNSGQHRYEDNDADDEPQALAYRPPVVKQMNLVFSVRVHTIVVRVRSVVHGFVDGRYLGLSRG